MSTRWRRRCASCSSMKRHTAGCLPKRATVPSVPGMTIRMTSTVKLALPDAPRLLIARPDRVGDVIISTSCLAPVRKAFPRGTIYFLAAERMRPLLENHPDLTGFISDEAQIARLMPDAIIHPHRVPSKIFGQVSHAFAR